MPEYIEREALLDDIENACVFSGRPNHENPKQMGARLVVQRIRCATAADVAPVVHGRWEEADDGDGAICSVCREDFCNIYLEVERFKYCPNCGAHMNDGE